MLAIGEGLDKGLDRLEGELAALRQQRREAQAELSAAVAVVQRLDGELEAGATEDALAVAAGGSPGPDRRKLHGDLALAKAQPDALQRKLTGIERAIERKESEQATFVAGHQAELFKKHAPMAAAKAQHVRAAL